jgi:hypothetical protein
MRRLKNKLVWLVLLLAFVWVSDVYANIVLRAVLVNTSTTQKRKIPFRSYLPKEIKPENIVDMGDLEVAFDPKEGTYYVFKDYELAPKETITVEIELEDIWKIPQVEISSLREEAGKLTKVLANTDYYERANYLKNSIETKLAQIEHKQSVVNSNPGGYISDYRDNLKLLDEVKSDLAAAKTLVAQAKSVAPMLTWKLIIAIVVFLGLLGLIFFIIWQKQIKSMGALTEEYTDSSEPQAPGPSAEEGERRQASEDKKSNISDIEERLKGSS